MKDKVLRKIEELQVRFDEAEVKRQELITQIKELETSINEIVDSQKQMQGEYKALIELAQEVGLVDQEGNLVLEQEAEEK